MLTDRMRLVGELDIARSFERAIDFTRYGDETKKPVVTFAISRGERTKAA